MTEMQMQFEEWLNGEFDAVAVKSLTTEGLPVYASLVVQRMWESWQASRAAIVVKLPEFYLDGDDAFDYCEGVENALDEAGVSYE